MGHPDSFNIPQRLEPELSVAKYGPAEVETFHNLIHLTARL